MHWTRWNPSAANPRQRLYGECFRQAGDAFEQGVAAASEHDQKLVDNFLLPDDDFGELGANVRREACEIFHLAFLRRTASACLLLILARQKFKPDRLKPVLRDFFSPNKTS